MTLNEAVESLQKEFRDIAIEIMSSAWIPVSERLPEENGEYFATYINHDPESYYDCIKDVPLTAPVVYYNGTWFWWSSVCLDILNEYGENHVDEVDGAIEITAWMPNPKPYKEET